MDAQTLAVLVTAPRTPVRVLPVPIREPGTGEVLVRMEACGVCHSDIFVAEPGKTAGRAADSGPRGDRARGGGRARALTAGARRSGRHHFLAASCGLCEFCLIGRERFCLKQRNFGFTVPGVLSEYATVPVPQLFRVPDGVTPPEWLRCAAPAGPPTGRCGNPACGGADRRAVRDGRAGTPGDPDTRGAWAERGGRRTPRSTSSRSRASWARKWRCPRTRPAARCKSSTADWTGPSCSPPAAASRGVPLPEAHRHPGAGRAHQRALRAAACWTRS